MEVCQTKASLLQALGATPDAYIAALEYSDQSSYRSLHGWALDHLRASNEPQVVAALKAFAVRLEASDYAMDKNNEVRDVALLLERGVEKATLTQLGVGARRVEEAEYLLGRVKEGEKLPQGKRAGEG